MSERIIDPDQPAPGLLCGRIIGPNRGCPADADWHVMFDLVTGDNGLACAAHLPATLAGNPGSPWHPYGETCSMPGAAYSHDLNECRPPETVEVTTERRPASPVPEPGEGDAAATTSGERGAFDASIAPPPGYGVLWGDEDPPDRGDPEAKQ